MCKILIIEDNTEKLSNLRNFVTEHYGSEIQIVSKMAYNSAQNEIVTNGSTYDQILLDISMYTYDGISDGNEGEPEPLAGENILRLMKLRQIKTPVIVVTMYESFVDGVKIKALDERFRLNFQDIYRGYVYYNVKNEVWKQDLLKKMSI